VLMLLAMVMLALLVAQLLVTFPPSWLQRPAHPEHVHVLVRTSWHHLLRLRRGRWC